VAARTHSSLPWIQRRRHEGSLLWQGPAPQALVSLALSALGDFARSRGDLARATPLLEESATLARGAGDAWVLGVALDALGVVAYYGADHGRAAALWQESLDLRRRLGDKRGIALSLASLGELAHARGDLARAVALLRENVAVARELGDKMDLAWSLHNLGAVALEQGDDVRAAALYEESLTLHLDVTGRGLGHMKDNLCGKKYFPQSCKDEMRESPVDGQINVLRLCQRRFFQNRQYFAVDSSKEYLPTQVAFHVAKSNGPQG